MERKFQWGCEANSIKHHQQKVSTGNGGGAQVQSHKTPTSAHTGSALIPVPSQGSLQCSTTLQQALTWAHTGTECCSRHPHNTHRALSHCSTTSTHRAPRWAPTRTYSRSRSAALGSHTHSCWDTQQQAALRASGHTRAAVAACVGPWGVQWAQIGHGETDSNTRGKI